MPLAEARQWVRPPEPLQRDHVEALPVEPPHHLATPLLTGAGGPFGLRHDRARAQHWMAIAKEGVRVRDTFVRPTADPQHRFAPPHVFEREREPVDLDPVTVRNELRGELGVSLRVGAPGQPPAVIPQLGWSKRRVREDVFGANVLATAERLEDGPARKLVSPVAEHRPV